MVAHYTLCTYDVNKDFFRKKIGFNDSSDVTKCHKHIEMHDLLRVRIMELATIYYKNHGTEQQAKLVPSLGGSLLLATRLKGVCLIAFKYIDTFALIITSIMYLSGL